jgi:hypothetical protein
MTNCQIMMDLTEMFNKLEKEKSIIMIEAKDALHMRMTKEKISKDIGKNYKTKPKLISI